MFSRLSAFCLFSLICSGAFSQETFTVVEDLREQWTRFEEGSYVPLEKGPATGLSTVYFTLRPSGEDHFLRIKSSRPYALFINGVIRGQYEGEVSLRLDSLLNGTAGANYRAAIYQDGINVRDLQTEIIAHRPAGASEAITPVTRPYSHLRDFVVVAGLVIIFLFVVVIRLNPKLGSDYFSVARLVSVRESDDSQASARLTSGANLQFYILCSLLIAYYLLIVLHNLPPRYSLPLHFSASGFGTMCLQWLELSGIILTLLLLKLLLVYSLTRLFGMRGMARHHFFNWIRLLLVGFALATAVSFTYFISRGSNDSVYVVFLSVVVVVLAIWMGLAFLKLGGRTGHSMFHLFSYLCATELIPLLITAKALFQ